MRFGHWRGVTLAIALISSMATTRAAFADGFQNTMPREVLARDLSTGQPYMAPAIPWGHYAKSGPLDHFGKRCGICGLLQGKGLGQCGGHGLFNLGGKGCGGAGCGLFNHGGDGCGDPVCGLGHGKRIKNCGLCKGKGCGLCNSSGAGEPIHALATEQAPAPARVVVTSPQAAPTASPQGCTEPGCKLGKGHEWGDPCGSCGGKGCGLCGGLGRIFGHHGDPCDSCGGKGCGKCGGLFKGCGFCGGKGCGKCGGLGSGLKGKISGLLHPHRGDIKYFVGPGGPVPLTPGYVPYVVPTRSPRDFLAFPPYTPDGF
jgi:hypothetical protein